MGGCARARGASPTARRAGDEADDDEEWDEDEDEYDDEYDDEDDEEHDDEAYGGYASRFTVNHRPAYDLTEAKLNVLDRQGRTDEYLALCQKLERRLRYAVKLSELKRVSEALNYIVCYKM